VRCAPPAARTRRVGERFKFFGDRRRDGLRPGEPWRVHRVLSTLVGQVLGRCQRSLAGLA
jgi:hypothetical protein